jgi:hypothetical protein
MITHNCSNENDLWKGMAEKWLLNLSYRTRMHALGNTETVVHNVYFNMNFHIESYVSCSNISLIIKKHGSTSI